MSLTSLRLHLAVPVFVNPFPSASAQVTLAQRCLSSLLQLHQDELPPEVLGSCLEPGVEGLQLLGLALDVPALLV